MSVPQKEKTEADESAPPKWAITSSGRGVVFFGAILLALIGFSIRSNPSRKLPTSYVLCTPDGKNVYLVDDTNSRVQCLAVQGSEITDVGDLGAYIIHIYVLYDLTCYSRYSTRMGEESIS